MSRKDRVIIGIDPGLKGGLVAMTSEGLVIDKMKMPLREVLLKTKHKKGKKKGQQKTQDRIDAAKLVDFFAQFHSPIVYCEKAAPIFGTPSNTTFRMGHGAGVVEGVCQALGLEFNEISPKDWQAQIWMESDLVMRQKRKESIKQSRVDTKSTSLNAYERLRGDFSAVLKGCRVAHDGIVDAFLLAYFGRQK